MKTHHPRVPAAPSPVEVEESVHDLHGDSLACPSDLAVSLPEEPPPKKHREMHLCSVCDFSSNNHLKRYQETIHRQSAGFSGQVCFKRFYRKDHPKKHRTRKHTNKNYERPSTHTCRICRKSFHYEGNYREHMVTYHPTVPTAPPSTEPEKPVHDSHVDSQEWPADLTYSLPEDCWQCYIEKWSQIGSR